ncbi:bacteriohemerythrin [Azohydromonas australica]|uniref:bacteriohemerythrin n=1 Tax=Azohydromonas australica TaxID=364039 RepID=UPI000686A078|nr:hypothetical protein [Azohydromonas australica]
MEESFEEFYAVAFTLLTCNGYDMLVALDAFDTYARKKFERENGWMLDTGFPHQKHHIEEHTAVLSSVQQLRRQITSGQVGVDLVHEFASCLFAWFPEHADNLDAALIAWINSYPLCGESMALSRPLENGHGIQ